MRIGQIAVPVQDVDRATRFYAETLGLTLLFRAGPLSFFDCGGVRLMLSRPEKPEFDHPGSILYFTVSDIENVHREWAERGVEFVDRPHLIARMPDHELWMVFFRDGEGNTLALMEEKRETVRTA